MNKKLHDYYDKRCFKDDINAETFFERTFHHQKRVYFDEVENANVWSFYLVQRDLHHTFEEYIIDRGLPPYALWSRPYREEAKDDIKRATLPIAETAAMYRKPVPKAGETINYTLEILSLESNSVTIGFLGYLVDFENKKSLRPSVVAAWERVFVQYSGDTRNVSLFPASVYDILAEDLCSDLWK